MALIRSFNYVLHSNEGKNIGKHTLPADNYLPTTVRLEASNLFCCPEGQCFCLGCFGSPAHLQQV